MRVRDVAARLEVSQSLVYGLIASGQLACSRVGRGRGVIRVSEQQLAAFLRSVETSTGKIAPAAPLVRLRHLRLS